MTTKNASTNPTAAVSTGSPLYQDPSAAIADRVEDLLARMTLDEKIGQMTQVEKNSIDPKTVQRLAIGSVLSGGGGFPPENTPTGWLAMVNEYLEAAQNTRLGIPLIYGVDSVHGHNNLKDAVIFPHNIGLGAAGDPDLVRRIARATAAETAATGARWNFAPTIAVPHDWRWGRTYEGYAEEPALVARLGATYVEGAQGEDMSDPTSVLATAKHFAGDGRTSWGSSTTIYQPVPGDGIDAPTPFIIDQGDTSVDEETFRAINLAPYIEAIAAGVQTIMASFSSWNGDKLHGHHYLLTEILKGEMGFEGFIVSDWAGIDQLSDDNYQAVVMAINAGIDMSMVPFDYPAFMANLRRAVETGDVSLARIDDAVRRILTVKMRAGLFENPVADDSQLAVVGSAGHRALAREAAAKSLVLLKNDGQLLPLAKDRPQILVAGEWADNIGLQCGGWTIEWQGGSGPITAGTSILEAIMATVSPATNVIFDPNGEFSELIGEDGEAAAAELGLLFVGEQPYAEGFGDRSELTLDPAAIDLLERMRGRCEQLVVVLVTGRPLIISEQLPLMDALVVAWLPGSEGQGVADVLFGDEPFSGRLSFTWPRTMDQIPLGAAGGDPLFPFGFGLS